jgi:hypothetical protein
VLDCSGGSSGNGSGPFGATLCIVRHAVLSLVDGG